MSVNLDTVKAITHNNKDVIQIADSNGKVLWKKPEEQKDIYLGTTSSDSQKLVATNNDFVATSWSGSVQPIGENIWGNGTSVYYTFNGSTYTVRFDTSSLTSKSWSGGTYPRYGNLIVKLGDRIWHINCTPGTISLLLLSTNNTRWEYQSNSGSLPSDFRGVNIIKWNGNYYHIYQGTVHKITVSGSTFTVSSIGTFDSNFNLSTCAGTNFWSPDNIHLYVSDGSYSYEITDLENLTYTTKSWINKDPSAAHIFSYKGKCCILDSSKVYELDVATSTWVDASSNYRHIPNFPISISSPYFYSEKGRETVRLQPTPTK